MFKLTIKTLERRYWQNQSIRCLIELYSDLKISLMSYQKRSSAHFKCHPWNSINLFSYRNSSRIFKRILLWKQGHFIRFYSQFPQISQICNAVIQSHFHYHFPPPPKKWRFPSRKSWTNCCERIPWRLPICWSLLAESLS